MNLHTWKNKLEKSGNTLQCKMKQKTPQNNKLTVILNICLEVFGLTEF